MQPTFEPLISSPQDVEAERKKIQDASKKRKRWIAYSLSAFAGILLVANFFRFAPNSSQATSTQHTELAEEARQDKTEAAATEVDVLATHSLNATLLTTMKEYGRWQEEQIVALGQELASKNSRLEDLEVQTFQQKEKITELKVSQEHLQADLEASLEDLQNLDQQLGQVQSELEKERFVKAHEVSALRSQVEESQALLAKIQDLEEENNRFKGSLEEKLQKVASLENQLASQEFQAKVTQLVDPQAQSKQELVQNNEALHAEQLRIRQSYAELQEKYIHENQQRTLQEALYADLAQNLSSQKESLKKLEQSRVALSKELVDVRQQATLQNEISDGVKPSGGVASSTSSLSSSVMSDQERSKPSTGKERIHLVVKGETLSGISLQYYGTSKRWEEIYEANKETIPNKNQIRAGIKLIIP